MIFLGEWKLVLSICCLQFPCRRDSRVLPALINTPTNLLKLIPSDTMHPSHVPNQNTLVCQVELQGVYLNGYDCVLPLPDAYPWLPILGS